MSARNGQSNWIPLGVGQIANTTMTTAVGFSSVPDGAEFVLLHITGGAGATCRWRDDGTAPTASIGMEIAGGDSHYFEYHGNLKAIQFIDSVGTPILDYAFYRYN